jgi:hypothetical protein
MRTFVNLQAPQWITPDDAAAQRAAIKSRSDEHHGQEGARRKLAEATHFAAFAFAFRFRFRFRS